MQEASGILSRTEGWIGYPRVIRKVYIFGHIHRSKEYIFN